MEGTRDPITAKVATGVSTFVTQRIDRAIYGSSWDAPLILEADTSGTWKRIQAPSQPTPDTQAAAQVSRINVNTARVADLATLPRIGPVRAQTIVDYRTRNGPFRSINDLGNVKGIGPATLLGLRDLVTIGSGS